MKELFAGENFSTLITGVIGFATTIISAWLSWFFARKKYNSEVDSQVISNMKESLDFYRALSDDTKLRLEEVLVQNREILKQNAQLLEQNAVLEKEVKELKIKVEMLSPKRQPKVKDNESNRDSKGASGNSKGK